MGEIVNNTPIKAISTADENMDSTVILILSGFKDTAIEIYEDATGELNVRYIPTTYIDKKTLEYLNS